MRITAPGSVGVETVDGDPGTVLIPAHPVVAPGHHHRYLLDTDFTVNDELVQTGCGKTDCRTLRV